MHTEISEKSPLNTAKTGFQYFQFDLRGLTSYDTCRSANEGMSEFALVSELPEKMNWLFEPLANIVFSTPGMLAWRLRNAPPSAPNRFGISRKHPEVTV